MDESQNFEEADVLHSYFQTYTIMSQIDIDKDQI